MFATPRQVAFEVSESFNGVTNGGGDVGEHGKFASSRVAQYTGTHRSKRLPARGCSSENDVWVVILEHAEKSLECRFVTKTAGQLESTVMSVRACVCFVLMSLSIQRTFVVSEMALHASCG